MDADLQNDPADIPKLLQFYGEYDLVNGCVPIAGIPPGKKSAAGSAIMSVIA